jgi:hypothetical protein
MSRMMLIALILFGVMISFVASLPAIFNVGKGKTDHRLRAALGGDFSCTVPSCGKRYVRDRIVRPPD